MIVGAKAFVFYKGNVFISSLSMELFPLDHNFCALVTVDTFAVYQLALAQDPGNTN